MRQVIVLLALLFAGPATARADATARDVLDAFASGLEGYRAEFSQRVVDASGRELESSTGIMVLASPDRFRWHYREPYEQLIVADGDRVWIYDLDLEQVTVRNQDTAAGESPLGVLTDPGSLEARFELEDRGEDNGTRFIGLRPRDETGDFELIELALRDCLVEGLVIRDRFGQVTRVRFQRPERNPVLDEAVFRFTPPPGVDVLGEADLLPAAGGPEPD